jgi:GTP-binding protein
LEFLRHVERTRMLAMIVDVTGDAPRRDLELLEREIALYQPGLLDKPRVVVLSKADVLDAEAQAEAARRAGLPDAVLISAHSGLGIETLLERFWVEVTRATPSSEDVKP